MDGEVSTVVELEVKGIYYLLEGTKEMIALMARGIQAFSEWNHERWLRAAGESSWQKIQEASSGAAPILEFPKELFEPQVLKDGREGPSVFDQYVKEHNLRFCIMPDLNPDDDYIPVAVVDHDISIHQEYIKRVMNERIRGQEARESAYEEAIRETEQTVIHGETEEARTEAAEQLQNLEQARNENHSLLTESREKLDRDNTLPFEEYLQMGKKSGYTDHMPEALRDYDRMGTVVREYMPNECMIPIRDAGKIPDSREIYYSQTDREARICTIRRDFATDEHGFVYSTYHVIPRGEQTREILYSDKGLTEEEWQKQIPVMLGQAGMQSDVPTAAIHSEERLARYVRALEERYLKNADLTQVPVPVSGIRREGSSKISQKQERKAEGKDVPADPAPGEELVQQIIRDAEQKEAYQTSLQTTLTVSPDQLLYTEGETLALELENGRVEGIEVVSLQDAEAQVHIDERKDYLILNARGEVTGSIRGVELAEQVRQESAAKTQGFTESATNQRNQVR